MLLNLLLGTVVDSGRPDLGAEVSERLQRVDDREWKECLRCLAFHRVEAAIWSSLLELGLRDSVPPFVARTLHRAHLTSVIRTTAQMRSLSVVLTALGRYGIEPILLKGVALLNSLYPNIGARPCGDIDLLVEPADFPTADKVMTELGYRLGEETADAKGYVDRQGISFDMHHRFRLFDELDGGDLLDVVKPRFASVPTVSLFEPNALLVHLVFHLRGHRPGMGYLLAWILDIGLLLDRYRSRLDIERIWALLPDRETAALLSRIVGFFALETGTTLIDGMPWERNGRTPLTSGEILRSRRRASWKFERPLSSLRFIATRLAVPSKRSLPELQLADVLRWPSDHARERRSVANTLPIPARWA